MRQGCYLSFKYLSWKFSITVIGEKDTYVVYTHIGLLDLKIGLVLLKYRWDLSLDHSITFTNPQL